MLNIEKYRNIVLDSLNYCTLDTGLKNVDTGLKEECNNRGCDECKKRLREWLSEEYKEPILDEEEKAYLSAVIKLFKANVTGICKLRRDIRRDKGCNRGFYYIRIYAESRLSEIRPEVIDLPLFEIDTMYKGMDTNKRYSLEELGLWHQKDKRRKTTWN